MAAAFDICVCVTLYDFVVDPKAKRGSFAIIAELQSVAGIEVLAERSVAIGKPSRLL